MNSKHKSYLKTSVKLIISFVLLFLLFRQVPIEKTTEHLKSIDLYSFIIALILMQLGVALQSIRWKKLLLLPESQKPKFKQFTYYIYLGYFFNLFMPSSLGGDVVKSYGLGKNINNLGKSASAIIIARFLGLSALMMLFWIGFVFTNNIHKPIWLSMILVSLSIGLMLFWIFTPFYNISIKTESNSLIISKIRKLANKIIDYKSQARIIFPALSYSFLIQAIIISVQYFVFKSLINDVSYLYFFAFIPIVNLVTLIPISLYGVGLREWIMLELFTNIGGIAPEVCLAAAFLSYLVAFFQAAIGGGLMLLINLRGVKE